MAIDYTDPGDMPNRFMELWMEQVTELLDVDLSLSDWEADFVNDIHMQLLGGKDLTPKQAQKLSELWHEKCEKGVE